MRAVVQRVKQSSVKAGNEMVGQIGRGLLVLLGVARDDTADDADYMVNKIINLRIFEDQDGKMNRSLLDTGGELLAVSQFTLLGISVQTGRFRAMMEVALINDGPVTVIIESRTP